MDTAPQAPPPTASLEESWAYLKDGMDLIMGDCSSSEVHPGVAYLHYMCLYTVSYNICTSGRKPTGGPNQALEEGGGEMETSGAPYLHNQITRYFEEYVENLASGIPSTLDDLSLLKLYAKISSNYFGRANYVNRLFTFLNRHWVKRKNEETKEKVLQVYGLTLKAFKEIYLFGVQSVSPTNRRLTDAVLQIVARGGEATLVGEILSNFVTLSPEAREGDPAAGGEDQVYADSFVEATQSFYKTEADVKAVRRCLGRKGY